MRFASVRKLVQAACLSLSLICIGGTGTFADTNSSAPTASSPAAAETELEDADDPEELRSQIVSLEGKKPDLDGKDKKAKEDDKTTEEKSKTDAKTKKQNARKRRLQRLSNYSRPFGRAMDVQDRHTARLMAEKGVMGTSLAMGKNGEPVIRVIVNASGNMNFPTELDGIPVEVEKRDLIFAHVDPKARFARPVPIGVSTSPVVSLCYSGTLGCKAFSTLDRNASFVLSNNHVLVNENTSSALTILQPATGDTNCRYSLNDRIAVTAYYVPITFTKTANNTVDAAIARMDAGKVSAKTPTDGYGAPQSSAVYPQVGMKVMKYGRTTGFTKGTITAINVTINVGYSKGTARFIRQFEVKGDNGKIFSSGGDSGSLVVTAADRRPVGLHFAGGGAYGYSNQIADVMSVFGLTVAAN